MHSFMYIIKLVVWDLAVMATGAFTFFTDTSTVQTMSLA